MTGTMKQVYDEYVKMDNGVTVIYRRVLNIILKNVIDNMKENNSTFNELYSRIYYTGSFYDGLKVGSSELEFDLDIVFNIEDSHMDIVDLGTDAEKPNFGFLRFTKARPTEAERSICFERDGEPYLSPEKMFRLIESSADRALTNSFKGQDVTVTRSIGAPYTLKVNGVFEGVQVKCSIDLVPAIELDIDKLPVDGSNDILNRVHELKAAFPCPQRDFMAISLWKADSNKFELDFHNIERGILYNKGCVKTVVKLIKHLRDIKGGAFMKLWSHLIKTVVMHQVIKNKADKTYWNEENLERCFIDSITALYRGLNAGIISDIFFPTFNMLSKIKQNQVINDTKQWLCSSLKMYQETGDATRMFDARMEAGQRNSEMLDMFDVQLQKFAESSSPPSEYVDLAKRSIQKAFDLLQKNSRQRLHHVSVVGGIERKTATAIKADIDAVVYYNEINNNVRKDDVMNDFQDVLLLNTSLTENDIDITKNSIKFSMDGVLINLLVAVNMVSNRPDLANDQSRKILQFIKQSVDPQKASEMNIAELSESSLEFIKSKSKFVHDVARLAKFWNQNILFKTNIFGGALIMELLAVDAAMEEENHEVDSISQAFQGYLKRVCHMKSQEIIFPENYKISDVPRAIRKQKPLLMDPSNPYNNLLHAANTKDGQIFTEMFQYCAGVTLNMMSNGCKDINLLFYPQPLLYQLQKKEKWIQPKYGTYYVSVNNIDKCFSFHQITSLPLMPEYILRDPQGSVLQDDLQSMLFTLAGFTYGVTKLNLNMPSGKIQDEVKGFVNKMSGVDREWVTRSWEHDKRAFTLVVPINDAQKRVLLLSFDFYVVNK